MTGGHHRRGRRGKARQGSTSTATHISSLGEDVVLEIFIRLPSLATLVRTALTCRAWRRAVASSPDFRRRFRALHPAPPLLGIFFDSMNDNAMCWPPHVPSFVPGGFRDWDLAGAVGGGDFLLTSLLQRSTEHPSPSWKMLDCRGGRVLLSDTYDYKKPLIVLNPLMRHSGHEFRYPGPDDDYPASPGPDDDYPTSPDDDYPTRPDDDYPTNPRLICLDEDPASSFRVALLGYRGSTLKPSVYSSDTREWSDLPAVDVPARLADDGTKGEASEKIKIEDQWKMQANGFLYWIYLWLGETGHAMDGRYLISLDTTTMEFSFAKLPLCLWSSHNFDAGEAEDGAACIVYSDGSGINNSIGVVKHTRGDDGVDRWVPDRVILFGAAKHTLGGDDLDKWVPDDRVFCVELDRDSNLQVNLGMSFCNKLSVLAVRDGYVYFATLEMGHDPRVGCWFMSLCLATMKVEKLFHRRYDGDAFPYIMPWPPCLLASNYGQFAFEGAP